ncbi:hypothetical protein [Pelagibius sp. Alg239-R121]|uniref:hypothetical protein n=1 Tax=Pelagibius sp. Alg239-R121 TaxID=2993448 RepID=UPI0024A6ED04|nr:hypothetical protein [Pelagibius sp. Alg239-R121]
MIRQLPFAPCAAFLFLALLFQMPLPAAGQMPESETVRIHYIPFDAETFLAITKENIESSATEYVEVHVNDQTFRKLKAILDAAGPGLVDLYKLRAKITLPFQEVIYIGQSGGVRSNFKGNMKLSESGRIGAEYFIKQMIESNTTR